MKKTLLIGLLSLGLGGCASVFGDHNRDVTINSNPNGATVYYNNQNMGTTPTTFQVGSKWSTNAIRVEKKGYETATRQVNTSFQPVGVLNIFFWPGFLIDAATGESMKITNPEISIPMSPVQ